MAKSKDDTAGDDLGRAIDKVVSDHGMRFSSERALYEFLVGHAEGWKMRDEELAEEVDDDARFPDDVF